MKLPKQSAPVERNITGAAISNQNGVEASLWGSLLAGAASLIPAIIDTIKK
jgi:hypothetical protein